ncbi:Kinase, NEK [Giardia muris]|uniref:Kinase, NEK n=1 Tax=Giardia muris TaxID=5742 RepID=A0A4Z1SNL8_GIAMU|nr:Kinase, NEK [Giardia muris]|eukprot:TNJ27384.1 Kinase, NEK [Giardia muris]
MFPTELMKAAERGDLEGVRTSLKDLGMQNVEGETALMKCARKGHSDCIPLLEKEIGMQDNYGRTALMLAADEGHFDCIPLLEREIGMQNNDGWTALMKAVVKGHSSCIPLLEKEIGMQNNDGRTSLMLAASTGQTDCARLLLSEAGEQMIASSISFPGATALMLAIHHNHPEIVQLLLPYERDKKDKNNQTALIWAAKRGYAEYIPFLMKDIGMQDNDGLTALMWAAAGGYTYCVQLLLSEVGKQLTKEWFELPSGTTALMLATCQNKVEVVQLLLPYEQGMTDSKGHTAKWYANRCSGRGDFIQIRKLLENEGTERFPPPPSPDISIQERANKPFVEIEALKKELVSSKKDLEEAKKELSQVSQENSFLKQQLTKTSEDLIRSHTESESLKRALADQKAQNLILEKEVTQLRTESHDMKDLRRRLEEVEEEKKVLLQNLAAVGGRLPPAREDSSLISSAIQGDLSTLRRHLDQAGQKDPSGMTALMHAASRGQTEVVRLLRPLEAHLQDGRGWTALMHAVRGGHEECIGLLLLERDMKDGEGRTAAEHAESEKMRRVLLNQPTLPVLPKNLSEYRLTAVLGKGAFGDVYAGHGNDRNVAVKVVSLGGHNDKERELLRREAEILLSLDHPNVLRCIDAGEDDHDDTCVIVTDLCCGDLRGEMNRRKKAKSSYSDQEVWKTIREVADALTYLHEKRHVHRDLKPANILLSSDGRCVLGGFEVAKVLGDSSRMSTYVGTLPYMAPEILRGENYNKSVDVWALGVVAYEMCTGRLPFRNVAAVLNETPAPPLEGRPSELAALIAWMLSRDPKDRPAAREVLEEAERHQ